MTGLGKLLDPNTRALWVASCGGHLAELKKIADLYPNLSTESAWVTFDTPQSRSMLQGANVIYVPRVGTRDATGTLQTMAKAFDILRGRTFDYVVSTGAAVAVSFLPIAPMFGAEAIYIESLTRTHGASTTGRILEMVPSVQTYTQYERWSNSRWRYAGSVLDNLAPHPSPTKQGKRILVSLGTIEPYRFDRAVDAVVKTIPADASVTWQLGATSRSDLPGVVHKELNWTDMGRLIRESDIFICHAGVGSVLQALDNGKVPVLAIRSEACHEHVDEHQKFFAQEIVSRGIATVLDMSGTQTEFPPQAIRMEPERRSSIFRTTQRGMHPVRRLPGTSLLRGEHHPRHRSPGPVRPLGPLK